MMLRLGGGYTNLWKNGMRHFDANVSFKSQMDQNLFNLILKIITMTLNNV